MAKEPGDSVRSGGGCWGIATLAKTVTLFLRSCCCSSSHRAERGGFKEVEADLNASFSWIARSVDRAKLSPLPSLHTGQRPGGQNLRVERSAIATPRGRGRWVGHVS
jgi:hypothetical protein